MNQQEDKRSIMKRIIAIVLLVCAFWGLCLFSFQITRIIVYSKNRHDSHHDFVDVTRDFGGFNDYCNANGLRDHSVDSLYIGSDRTYLTLVGTTSLQDANELVSMLLRYIEGEPQCVISNDKILIVYITSGNHIVNYTVDFDNNVIDVRIPQSMLNDELGDSFERNVRTVTICSITEGSDIDTSPLVDVFPNAEITVE